MWIQVFLLPYQSNLVQKKWVEDTDSVKTEQWITSSSLWPNCLEAKISKTDFLYPVEVFLCYDEDLGSRYINVGYLRDLLEMAHKVTWGGAIYVVVNQRLDSAESLYFHRQVYGLRTEWFEALKEKNVTDILEVSGDLSENKLVDSLNQAASRSRRRKKIIKNLESATDRPWKCFIYEEIQGGLAATKQFFLDFICDDPILEDYNCVWVIPSDPSEKIIDFLVEKLKYRNPYNVLIVCVDKVNDDISYKLKAIEKEKYQVVVCRGLFELHYLLQSLNIACDINKKLITSPGDAKQESESVSNGTSVFYVKSTAEPRFKHQSQGLLITHGFEWNGKYKYVYAAAQETYEIRKRIIHNGIKFFVHPVVTIERLSELLLKINDEACHLVAWVHIGHGSAQNGIMESNTLQLYEPQKWLNCFAIYKEPLPLVCFSVCESIEAARLFAEAGVKVAIGYRNKVHIEDSRTVSRMVIEAALRSNGQAYQILQSFHQARYLIKNKSPEAMPVAFYSNQ